MQVLCMNCLERKCESKTKEHTEVKYKVLRVILEINKQKKCQWRKEKVKIGVQNKVNTKEQHACILVKQ